MHFFNVKVRQLAIVFFVLLFFGTFSHTSTATFFGEVKTGLQNVASDRYGYSVFVPQDYTPDQKWPLVLALHDEGKKGEDYIQSWIEAAKKRGMIVLCPTYEYPRNGLPFEHDERLIGLKRSIQTQYEIDPNRILVTGFGNGGHYAFYLGLRYPKEFTAIASIGNGFKGILQKLFNYSYSEIYQLPILMLVKPDEKMKDSEMLEQLKEIQKRGYLLETVEAENPKDLENPDTNSYVLEWFRQVSAEREANLKERSFSLKQTFYEWVDNLFQSR